MQIWISAVRISWDPSFAQLQPFLLFSATVSATVRCEGKSRDKERHSLPRLVTCLTPARHPPSKDSLDTQHLGSHATQAPHQHGKDPAWDHTALRWGGVLTLSLTSSPTTHHPTRHRSNDWRTCPMGSCQKGAGTGIFLKGQSDRRGGREYLPPRKITSNMS